MKSLATPALASLLALAVFTQVAPGLAAASDAQPQCGDEKKGDSDKKDDKGETKPKPPSHR